jgi:hypothetical protein
MKRLKLVPAAGMAQVVNYDPRSVTQNPAPKTDPNRNQKRARSRAIRSLQEIARSNQLQAFVTLTFREPTDIKTVKKEWTKALRSRKVKPVGPYICVPEKGEMGTNLHLHVMMRADAATRLCANWKHGYTDNRALEFGDIDYLCVYLGKGFAQPDRPSGRRYWASRGIKPIAEKHVALEDEEIDALIASAAGDGDPRVTYAINTNFGAIFDVRWNPHSPN